MSLLKEALAKVLAGEILIRSAGELQLLKHVASFEELEKLEMLEKAFHERERKSTQAVPPTKADVQHLIDHPDNASLQELERLLKNAKDLRLSSREEERIRQHISQLAGQLYRNEERPTELDRLGWKRTPVGYLDPQSASGFDKLRLAGFRAIDNCANHAGRGCACCVKIRDTLWRVRGSFQNGTPESWMCDRLLDELGSYDRLRPSDLQQLRG